MKHKLPQWLAAISLSLTCLLGSFSPVFALESAPEEEIYSGDSVFVDDDDEVSMISQQAAAAIVTEFPAETYALETRESIERNEYAQIWITTSDGTGNSLTKEAGYTNGDTRIQIIPAESDTQSKVIDDANCSVKVRGNSTAGGWKKPYNFKLSKKTSVLSMAKEKTWVLLANHFDPSYLRNYLAFECAHHLGLTYTPHQQFVRLYMDGVYKGCYTLMEKIDKVTAVDEDKGEFLLEFDRRVEDGVSYVYGNGSGFSDANAKFALSIPEEPTPAQLSHIEQCIANFQSALASRDWTALQAICDVESFVNFYLLNEYWKTLDFRHSSVYFYYQNGKFHAGPVWDFDLSCGNASYNEAEYDNYNNLDRYSYEGWNDPKGNSDSTYGIWCANYNWYPDLFAFEEFQDLFSQTYAREKSWLKNVWQSGGLMDNVLAQYRPLIEENYASAASGGAGWDVTYTQEYISVIWQMGDRSATYDTHLDFLRNWFAKRDAWVESSLESELRAKFLKTDTSTQTSGRWGTAQWSLNNGTLTIGSGTADDSVPAWDKAKIQNVVSSGSLTFRSESVDSVFKDCVNLKTADLSGWNLSAVSSLPLLFDGCTNLTAVILPQTVPVRLESLYGAFRNCTSLRSISWPDWNLSTLKDVREAFKNCASLQSLDLSVFGSASLEDAREMLSGCSALTSFNPAQLSVNAALDLSDALYSCLALKEITLNENNSALAAQLEGEWSKDGSAPLSGAQILETWSEGSAGIWSKYQAPQLDSTMLMQAMALAKPLANDKTQDFSALQPLLTQANTVLENAEQQRKLDEMASSLNAVLLSLRLAVHVEALSAL